MSTRDVTIMTAIAELSAAGHARDWRRDSKAREQLYKLFAERPCAELVAAAETAVPFLRLERPMVGGPTMVNRLADRLEAAAVAAKDNG